MSRNQLGNYVITALVAIHILLWLLFPPSHQGYPFFSVNSPKPQEFYYDPGLETVGEMLSSTGLLLMACALVLTNKPRSLERYFGGLDKMYVTHRTVALIAVILIVIHQMVVPKSGTSGPGLWLGWTAFFCIIIVVLITVGPRVPLLSGFLTGFSYSGWRKIHRFMGVFFIIAVGHMMLVQPMIFHSAVLSVWILTIEAVGIGAYLYKQFLWRRLRPFRAFTVEAIKKLNGTTLEIRMKPKNGKLKYLAGQFLFVHFEGDPLFTEPHPFTISSAPHQDQLIISIKASGDWTGRLHEALKVGANAYVDGPYGQFNYKTGGPDQVWIAGGIGITPFLSWMRDFDGPREHDIHFFYTAAQAGEALFTEEIELAAQKNPRFSPHISYSSEHGRLSVGKIIQTSGPVKGKDIYLCGPVTMVQAFRDAFIKQGLPAAKIHYEEFNFR